MSPTAVVCVNYLFSADVFGDELRHGDTCIQRTGKFRQNFHFLHLRELVKNICLPQNGFKVHRLTPLPPPTHTYNLPFC